MPRDPFKKPHVHGRDHEHGGADPTKIHYQDVGGPGSGGGGIQFDTDNEGGWLYVQANDATEAGGSVHGYAIDFRDRTGTGSSQGIELNTFNSMRLESSLGQTMLAHDGGILIESDHTTTYGDPTPSVAITAPTGFVSIGGGAGVVISTGGAGGGANLDLNPSGDASLTGNTVSLVSATGAVNLGGSGSIGAATDDLGFFGATPVPRPAHPVTLADVITALVALGLVAP